MTSPALIAKLQQAHGLLLSGKAEQAVALLQRLSPKDQNNPDFATLMSMSLMQLGRIDQSVFYARRAVLPPGDTAVNSANLAAALVAQGTHAEGLEWADKALALDPTLHDATITKCNALAELGRAEEMLAACEASFRTAWHPQVCVSYAAACNLLGHTDRAIAFLKEATTRFPDETSLADQLCMALTSQWGADPSNIAATHRDFGALVNRVKPPYTHAYQPTKDASKKLRIGLVSPDLRRHSVSFFIEPLLDHIDKDQFDIACYYRSRVNDDVTQRFRGKAAVFRNSADLTELQLGALMAQDGVDIAIDLAGHTDSNSLLAFGLCIAPVQATYCGYPDTTGLQQMDWRIVDSHTDPHTPDVNARATEELYRLDPCFLCYRPPANAPEPSRDKDLTLTFGSFNAIRKLNPHTIALWSRLLHEVPGSRLILKHLDLATDKSRQRLLDQFAPHNVQGRVEVLGPQPDPAAHLALYARIDIALDPLPYHGTTTTCEALWMGVPVLTTTGRTHAGRVGVSLLTNVGVPELIATDDEHFLELAKSLAHDPARLAHYRATLRANMQASPLLDQPAFTRRFESALRHMWQQYCASPSAH